MINFNRAISEELAYALFRDAPNKHEQVGILADLLCCKRSDVLKWLCGRGVDVAPLAQKHRVNGAKWTKREQNRLIKMEAEGKSRQQISKVLNRTPCAIAYRLTQIRKRNSDGIKPN